MFDCSSVPDSSLLKFFFSFCAVRKENLRPAGSVPGAVCQEIFLKFIVSLSGFGPSEAHGKLSLGGQATNNKAKTCSLLDAIERRSCGRPRDWV